MREAWLAQVSHLAAQPADFYSGARKILTNVHWTIPGDQWHDDLTLADSGFTKVKLTLLRKLYVHKESMDVAKMLWDKRLGQRKYGSVGFTCYAHFIKNDPEKKSKRASVMGPCIQSVTLTYGPKHKTTVDVFYRTTEFLKKFPADLVLLQEMLSEFDFENAPIEAINFHFANVTMHPMYYVTVLPLSNKPLAMLKSIRPDERFWIWVIKWTARYLCEEYEHGIAKFSQALRVQMDAQNRLTPKQQERLANYIRKHHPGIRGHDH